MSKWHIGSSLAQNDCYNNAIVLICLLQITRMTIAYNGSFFLKWVLFNHIPNTYFRQIPYSNSIVDIKIETLLQ